MKYKLLFRRSTDELDDLIFDNWDIDYTDKLSIDSYILLNEEQVVFLKLKFPNLDLITIHNPNSESQILK